MYQEENTLGNNNNQQKTNKRQVSLSICVSAQADALEKNSCSEHTTDVWLWWRDKNLFGYKKEAFYPPAPTAETGDVSTTGALT